MLILLDYSNIIFSYVDESLKDFEISIICPADSGSTYISIL